MSFLLFYPVVAAVAMLVLAVIFVILKHGPRLCKLRHHALPDDHEWRQKGYEQHVSYA